jgi:gluconokinase
MTARKGHYMKAGLLESQFAALEEPIDAITVDVGAAPEAIADTVEAALNGARMPATGSRR